MKQWSNSLNYNRKVHASIVQKFSHVMDDSLLDMCQKDTSCACLKSEHDSISKSCVIKGLSPHESFSIAMDLLNKVKVTVNQTKIINKLAGPETHIVQYNL